VVDVVVRDRRPYILLISDTFCSVIKCMLDFVI
jgi:hypothetical protein